MSFRFPAGQALESAEDHMPDLILRATECFRDCTWDGGLVGAQTRGGGSSLDYYKSYRLGICALPRGAAPDKGVVLSPPVRAMCLPVLRLWR